MHPLNPAVGTWTGSNAFRMMPDDPFVEAPSAATAQLEAKGQGWLLRYTWEHPDDGEQTGTLLVGSPDDDGTVTAGWIDSWHQQPPLRAFTGTASESEEDPRIDLGAEYGGGWRWQISLVATDEGLTMTMSNVIPDGHDADPGPYPVMLGAWG